MELKTHWTDIRSQAPVRRAWYALPGVGPAPRLRRRVIAIVPAVSRTRRMRWQAGTVLPGVGPTARMQRRGRAATLAGKQVVRHPRTVARGARAVDWPGVIRAASTLAATPRRRRRTGRAALIGAAGIAGAGAAATAIARRRSREAAAGQS
jgi:hypothetical protein